MTRTRTHPGIWSDSDVTSECDSDVDSKISESDVMLFDTFRSQLPPLRDTDVLLATQAPSRISCKPTYAMNLSLNTDCFLLNSRIELSSSETETDDSNKSEIEDSFSSKDLAENIKNRTAEVKSKTDCDCNTEDESECESENTTEDESESETDEDGAISVRKNSNFSDSTAVNIVNSNDEGNLPLIIENAEVTMAQNFANVKIPSTANLQSVIVDDTNLHIERFALVTSEYLSLPRVSGNAIILIPEKAILNFIHSANNTKSSKCEFSAQEKIIHTTVNSGACSLVWNIMIGECREMTDTNDMIDSCSENTVEQIDVLYLENNLCSSDKISDWKIGVMTSLPACHLQLIHSACMMEAECDYPVIYIYDAIMTEFCLQTTNIVSSSVANAFMFSCITILYDKQLLVAFSNENLPSQMCSPVNNEIKDGNLPIMFINEDSDLAIVVPTRSMSDELQFALISKEYDQMMTQVQSTRQVAIIDAQVLVSLISVEEDYENIDENMLADIFHCLICLPLTCLTTNNTHSQVSILPACDLRNDFGSYLIHQQSEINYQDVVYSGDHNEAILLGHELVNRLESLASYLFPMQIYETATLSTVYGSIIDTAKLFCQPTIATCVKYLFQGETIAFIDPHPLLLPLLLFSDINTTNEMIFYNTYESLLYTLRPTVTVAHNAEINRCKESVIKYQKTAAFVNESLLKKQCEMVSPNCSKAIKDETERAQLSTGACFKNSFICLKEHYMTLLQEINIQFEYAIINEIFVERLFLPHNMEQLAGDNILLNYNSYLPMICICNSTINYCPETSISILSDVNTVYQSYHVFAAESFMFSDETLFFENMITPDAHMLIISNSCASCFDNVIVALTKDEQRKADTEKYEQELVLITKYLDAIVNELCLAENQSNEYFICESCNKLSRSSSCGQALCKESANSSKQNILMGCINMESHNTQSNELLSLIISDESTFHAGDISNDRLSALNRDIDLEANASGKLETSALGRSAIYASEREEISTFKETDKNRLKLNDNESSSIKFNDKINDTVKSLSFSPDNNLNVNQDVDQILFTDKFVTETIQRVSEALKTQFENDALIISRPADSIELTYDDKIAKVSVVKSEIEPLERRGSSRVSFIRNISARLSRGKGKKVDSLSRGTSVDEVINATTSHEQLNMHTPKLKRGFFSKISKSSSQTLNNIDPFESDINEHKLDVNVEKVHPERKKLNLFGRKTKKNSTESLMTEIIQVKESMDTNTVPPSTVLDTNRVASITALDANTVPPFTALVSDLSRFPVNELSIVSADDLLLSPVHDISSVTEQKSSMPVVRRPSIQQSSDQSSIASFFLDSISSTSRGKDGSEETSSVASITPLRFRVQRSVDSSDDGFTSEAASRDMAIASVSPVNTSPGKKKFTNLASNDNEMTKKTVKESHKLLKMKKSTMNSASSSPCSSEKPKEEAAHSSAKPPLPPDHLLKTSKSKKNHQKDGKECSIM